MEEARGETRRVPCAHRLRPPSGVKTLVIDSESIMSITSRSNVLAEVSLDSGKGVHPPPVRSYTTQRKQDLLEHRDQGAEPAILRTTPRTRIDALCDNVWVTPMVVEDKLRILTGYGNN
jgi:hypothetical protein